MNKLLNFIIDYWEVILFLVVLVMLSAYTVGGIRREDAFNKACYAKGGVPKGDFCINSRTIILIK